MSAQGNRHRSLRLFVAVYPPKAVTHRLVQAVPWQRLPPHRRTPTNQVHLTLLFLGRSAIRDLSRIEESIERSASGIPPFELVPGRFIALPEQGPARVIAAQTHAPAALLELRRRLVRRLASSSRREPNDRFVPHLTLARIAPPSRVTLTPLGEDQRSDLSSSAFPVTTIHLMESRLRPSGAEHETVAEVRLVP